MEEEILLVSMKEEILLVSFFVMIMFGIFVILFGILVEAIARINRRLDALEKERGEP